MSDQTNQQQAPDVQVNVPLFVSEVNFITDALNKLPHPLSLKLQQLAMADLNAQGMARQQLLQQQAAAAQAAIDAAEALKDQSSATAEIAANGAAVVAATAEALAVAEAVPVPEAPAQ
jgi:hypothetical protein